MWQEVLSGWGPSGVGGHTGQLDSQPDPCQEPTAPMVML